MYGCLKAKRLCDNVSLRPDVRLPFSGVHVALQLLEMVKRFMTLRVKSDKEYAALLLNMTQQMEKQEAADYVSTVSKVSPRPGPACPPLLCVVGSRHACSFPSVLVSGGASDGGAGAGHEESR